jgi:hypothetical protein
MAGKRHMRLLPFWSPRFGFSVILASLFMAAAAISCVQLFQIR